jgi:hypothetical protein
MSAVTAAGAPKKLGWSFPPERLAFEQNHRSKPQYSIVMTSPSPISCIEKERLLREFAKAVSEHHRMQSAQTAAVLSGADFPFEEEIARASAQRENAKYAVLLHQQEHGC